MKAMILAAGLGSRLGELTRDRPKCLMEAGGRTMLEHVIHKLALSGITEYSINLFHHADAVREFLIKSEFYGLPIHLFEEDQLLGTGGGIKNMRSFVADAEMFLVHNCDVYSEIDLGNLLTQHRESDALATLVVQQRQCTRALWFDRNGILFPSIPAAGQQPPSQYVKLAFSGIHIISPRIFDYMLNEQGAFSIIDTYMKARAAGERIAAYNAGQKFWIDIGKPDRLKQLDLRLRTKTAAPQA